MFLIAEIIVLILNLIIFYGFSKRRSKFFTSIFFALHLALIYCIGEGFNKFHHYLRDNKIYIETGHASIIEIYIVMGFAIISVIYFLYLLVKEKSQ